MEFTGLNGTKYHLDANPLISGGEGSIYHVLSEGEKKVAKIYHAGSLTPDLEKKIIYMVAHPPESRVLGQIAWPTDVLYDANGAFCGFVMPELEIIGELREIYQYPPSSRVSFSLKDKIVIATNICRVIDAVHKAGYVFGDFNPKNIAISASGYVAFLDVDSYHFTDSSSGETYRCNVCADGYAAPELLERCAEHAANVPADKNELYAKTPFPTFTRETDYFALAIHIFKLLMNGHTPFGGITETVSASSASPSVGNTAIRRNEYCFRPGYKPLSAAVPPLGIFPQEVADLFTRAFLVMRTPNPQERPSPREWYEALQIYHGTLIQCSEDPLHYYDRKNSTCPFCEADRRFEEQSGVTVRPKPKKTSSSSASSSKGNSDSSLGSGDKKFQDLLAKAEKGDADAQYNVGGCYYNGKGVRQDRAKAVEWYTKAAKQGNAEAQYDLGHCYRHSIGTRKDYEKAVEWYTKAAKQGNADAQYSLGYCYQYGIGTDKNLEKAILWYTKATQHGHAGAQTKLQLLKSTTSGNASVNTSVNAGSTPSTPAGVKAGSDSFSKVVLVLLIAAACIAVIFPMFDGNNTVKIDAPVSNTPKVDVTGSEASSGGGQTFDDLLAKATQGDAVAQYNLGVRYYNGQGVEKDYSKAIYWWMKAAEQGNNTAKDALKTREPAVFSSDSNDKEFKDLLARATQGNVWAQFSLGWNYANGDGVRKDYVKAAYWYTLAAEQGNARAQNNLGVCYENGQGVEKNHDKAAYWYKLAAEQGNVIAQTNLGWCYENGYGVRQDYELAVEWYTLAAKQGNNRAYDNLNALKSTISSK